MKEAKSFIFSGEKHSVYYFGLLGLLVIEIIIFLSVFLAKNAYGVLVSFVLLLIIPVYCRRIIREVVFNDSGILIRYFYGKKIGLNYEDIQGYIRKNQEGFLGYVYVFYFTKKGKKLKATFYCNQEEFSQLQMYLLEKNTEISNSTQWEK